MKGAILLLHLTVFFLLGCSKPIEKEWLRIASPDGKLEAVLIEESHGGAAGSVVHNVYIVQKGKRMKYKTDELVFEATRIEDAELKWVDRDILEIRYAQAKILHFRNYLTQCTDDKCKDIEIRETPLTLPPSSKK